MLIGLFTLDSSWRQGLIVSMVTALIALSIVLLTGYVGQISLMPLALAGISAFAMIKLTVSFHVPFPIAPLLAALVATAFGLVIGLPAVRVRGINLAIATLAAATAVEELVLKWSWFSGGLGGASVPRPRLFGVDLGIGGDRIRLPPARVRGAVPGRAGGHVGRGGQPPPRRHRPAVAGGPRQRAGRVEHERRRPPHEADRVRVCRASSAGLGGTLLAYEYDTLSVNSFTVFASLALVATTYLGGIASIAGAMVAGLVADGGVLTALIGSKSSAATYAVNGLMLMVIAVVYPDGLIAGARSAGHWLLARVRPVRVGPNGPRGQEN